MTDQPKNTQPNYKLEAAAVMWIALELGFIIALPIVLLGFGGKWLDSKLHAGYFVYIGIVLAILSTTAWLSVRFGQIAERLKKASENKDIKS